VECSRSVCRTPVDLLVRRFVFISVAFSVSLSVFLSLSATLLAQSSLKTENVIFVMTDGLRWQEVFRGAENQLIDKQRGKVSDVEATRKNYWRDSQEARREALMPFLWTVVARNGQIFGNRDTRSEGLVTNGLNFSYPGYSETLCGFVDPRVKSNDKVANPNATVLEWLNKKGAFHDRVAAFGAWDVFPFIFHAERAGFPVNAGYDPFTLLPGNPTIDILNHAKLEAPKVWDEEPFDWIPFRTALEYLKVRKPRLLYISLGETDDWAHEGRYDEYLNAAHRADDFLRILWETVQSLPEYRDHTTLIFSPDHGRGDSGAKWKDHGQEVPESKYIWMAFLGPDTKPLGERRDIPAVTQNQIAATLAAFLGEDYRAETPRAGKPIADVLPGASTAASVTLHK
jgi:hypothetical protein